MIFERTFYSRLHYEIWFAIGMVAIANVQNQTKLSPNSHIQAISNQLCKKSYLLRTIALLSQVSVLIIPMNRYEYKSMNPIKGHFTIHLPPTLIDLRWHN